MTDFVAKSFALSEKISKILFKRLEAVFFKILGIYPLVAVGIKLAFLVGYQNAEAVYVGLGKIAEAVDLLYNESAVLGKSVKDLIAAKLVHRRLVGVGGLVEALKGLNTHRTVFEDRGDQSRYFLFENEFSILVDKASVFFRVCGADGFDDEILVAVAVDIKDAESVVFFIFTKPRLVYSVIGFNAAGFFTAKVDVYP